jgi:hypothetical protein
MFDPSNLRSAMFASHSRRCLLLCRQNVLEDFSLVSVELIEVAYSTYVDNQYVDNRNRNRERPPRTAKEIASLRQRQGQTDRQEFTIIVDVNK